MLNFSPQPREKSRVEQEEMIHAVRKVLAFQFEMFLLRTSFNQQFIYI